MVASRGRSVPRDSVTVDVIEDSGNVSTVGGGGKRLPPPRAGTNRFKSSFLPAVISLSLPCHKHYLFIGCLGGECMCVRVSASVPLCVCVSVCVCVCVSMCVCV